MRHAAVVGLVVGALLLAVSFVWTAIFAGKPGLSNDDYARLEQLENKIVDMYQQIERIKTRTGEKATAEEASVGYQNAIKERDALRTKLESGVQRPQQTARIMRYSGLALLVAGLIAYQVGKPA